MKGFEKEKKLMPLLISYLKLFIIATIVMEGHLGQGS
jgi:hypothetical protein